MSSISPHHFLPIDSVMRGDSGGKKWLALLAGAWLELLPMAFCALYLPSKTVKCPHFPCP